jgi:hypothetical protein
MAFFSCSPSLSSFLATEQNIYDYESTDDKAPFTNTTSGSKIVMTQSNKEEYKEMDALCTLHRYPHLFGRFCHPLDRDNCDFNRFEEYFQKYEQDRLEWGCPLDEAICYAKRYRDLFQGYCNDDESNCNYYNLRKHYNMHGIKSNRIWGCEMGPFHPAPTVSKVLPLTTLNKYTLPSSTKHQSVLGKASLETFQGTWEPVEFDEETYPRQTICPKCGKSSNYFCNLRGRKDYVPAQYVAPGLPAKFQAIPFAERLTQDGGIAFVGDSLAHQPYAEFICQIEAQQTSSNNITTMMSKYNIQFYEGKQAAIPDSVYDRYELRNNNNFSIERFLKIIKMDWVDDVIRTKPKYVVFVTAAWWNPNTWYRRGEWCDYGNWESISLEEVLGIYTEVMENVILPTMTSLVEDHGIIPIWMDMPPAGRIDLQTGIQSVNAWKGYYYLFYRYNQIGRDIMARAGGLILPLWDATVPRWQDHRFVDNVVGFDDQLHWCHGVGHNNVPTVWLNMLARIIYGDSLKDNSAQRSLRQSPVIQFLTPGNQTTFAVGHPERRASKNRLLHLNEEPTNTMPFVPHSKSHGSSCLCSEAPEASTNPIKCWANTRCSWDTKAEICIDRFRPQDQQRDNGSAL